MVDWKDESGNKKDEKAFLFSLDNKTKYQILKSGLAFHIIVPIL